MRNLHRLHVSLRCLVVALVAACSSSSSTPSPDAAVVTDTPAVTDAPAVTDTAPASDTTPAGDAGACVDFTGGYTVTGTCSLPGVVPFPAVCIAQTGCSAQINLEGAVVTGTVVGGRLTFTTSTMGVPLTCTVDRNGDGSTAVRCEAAGGAVTCDAVAAAPSFPGATRFCCNVTAQDCGAGQRCTVVGVGASNNTSLTACVPAGTTAVGGACTRTDGRLGADNCAAGSSCVNYGQAMASSRVCVRTCTRSSECADGESCFVTAPTPGAGVCRARCTLGDAMPCAAGTCRYVNGYNADGTVTLRAPTCQPVGTATESMPCSSDTDCAAGLACSRRTGSDPFTCRPLCDRTRPCAAGTCTGMMSDANPAAAGTCFP